VKLAWETQLGSPEVRICFYTEGGHHLAWSPNSARLAVCGITMDEECVMGDSSTPTLRVVDAKTGRREATLECGDRAAVWSPDGRLLATVTGFYLGSDDLPSVQLWDTKSFAPRSGVGRRGEAFCAAFSPDGAQLATGTGKGEVKLWDLSDGQVAARPHTHPSVVWGLAWSPDGRCLASVCARGQVRVWDLARERIVWKSRPRKGPYFVHRPAWSPGGRRLHTPGGPVTVWDARTGAALRRITGVDALTAAPGLRRYLYVSGQRLAMMDSATGAATVLGSLDGQGKLELSCSPDGRRLAYMADTLCCLNLGRALAR